MRGRLSQSEFEIEVESWGVPLTEEEANSDMLFRENVRGRFPKSLGLTGTGLGLFEVDNFVKKIQGKRRIDTNPVNKEIRNPKPTKTIFIISLPRKEFEK